MTSRTIRSWLAVSPSRASLMLVVFLVFMLVVFMVFRERSVDEEREVSVIDDLANHGRRSTSAEV